MAHNAPVATISFDDGGVFDNAVVVLLQHLKIPATFYLTTSLLTEAHYQLYKMDQIRALYPKEMEIGGHGRLHKRVTEIQQEHLEEEITKPAVELEMFFQTSVKCYAYPYGTISMEARAVIARSFLEYARGVRRNDPAAVAKVHDQYNIPVTLQFNGGDDNQIHRMMDIVSSNFPIHILAHSWEIGRFNWWEALKTMLTMIKDRYTFVTNYQFFQGTMA